MCEFCANWKEQETLYQESTYCDLLISHLGNKPVLMVGNIRKGCSKYVKCSAKEVPINVAFIVNYCPNCGAELQNEAYGR